MNFPLMRSPLLFVLALSLPALIGCKSSDPLHAAGSGETQYYIPEDHGPPLRALPTNLHFPTVTRHECMATAQRYLEHTWTPSEKNIFHGIDADGIRVDTPNSAYKPSGTFPGWWVPGLMNRGIPYQWGGFSTIEEFDQGIANGRYAGDIYTPQKRAQLDDAVSKHAVGIDCSGFVSRCWKLPRSFSTRELPKLCVELKSYDDLLPGDILNTHNAHVLLFSHWLDPDRKSFVTYETGSPPTWKVLRHGLRCSQLLGLGYKPYRYRNMR